MWRTMNPTVSVLACMGMSPSVGISPWLDL